MGVIIDPIGRRTPVQPRRLPADVGEREFVCRAQHVRTAHSNPRYVWRRNAMIGHIALKCDVVVFDDRLIWR